MPFDSTSQTFPIPIPVLGYDSRVPLFNMPQQYSPFLFNYEVEDGYLKKRAPHTLQVAGGLNNTLAAPVVVRSQFSTTEQVISVQEGLTGTTDGTATSATPLDVFPYALDYTFFNNVLFITGATGAYAVNTTTLVYTLAFAYGPTVLAPIRRPITSFRNRVYMGEGTNLGYGALGAVAGAMTTYPMAAVVTGSIIALARLSISASFTPQAYLVVGTSRGDIAVFNGTDPADPSWSLVFSVSLPIPERSGTTIGPQIEFIEIPNDVMINIKDSPQIYSLKQLMTTGLTSEEDLPFDAMRPFINLSVPLAGTTPACRKSCAYLPTDNSLIVLCNFIGSNPLLTPWYTSGDFPAKAISYTGSGTTEQVFLLKYSLGSNKSITPHTCPQGSSYAQIRAGGKSVYCGNMWDIMELFDPTNGLGLVDYDPATSFIVEYSSVCKFAPPNASNNKKIHDLIMYSNLVASNTFSYQTSKLFNVTDTVFTPFTALSTDLSIQANILSTGLLQKTSIIGIRERTAVSTTPFSCYGIDMLLEVGGNF